MSNTKINTILCIASSIAIICSFAAKASSETTEPALKAENAAQQAEANKQAPAQAEQAAPADKSAETKSAGKLVDQMLKDGKVSKQDAAQDTESKIALISEDGVAFKAPQEIAKTLPREMKEGWYYLTYDIKKTQETLGGNSNYEEDSQDGYYRDDYRDDLSRDSREPMDRRDNERSRSFNRSEPRDDYKNSDFRDKRDASERPNKRYEARRDDSRSMPRDEYRGSERNNDPRDKYDRRSEDRKSDSRSDRSKLPESALFDADGKVRNITMKCTPKESTATNRDGKKMIELECSVG